MAGPADDLLTVGRIGAPRGVRGELFVQPFTDDPQTRFAVGSVLRTEPVGAGPLTVESLNLNGAKMVLGFAGVADRGAAEALRGVRLVIPAGERPAIDDPDEFYASELVGLAAHLADGTGVGRVRDVVDIAGADYLVLDVDGFERLVPFVASVVPTVDIAGGRVVLDPRRAVRSVTGPAQLRLDVVTIFPDYLDPLRQSLLGRAIERGQISLSVHDLRRWADDVHRSVDDTPYGGGPGMVMSPVPWGRALDELAPPGPVQPRMIVPTPAGRRFTQADAARLAAEPWLLFACGRYEGIDARVAEHAATRMPVEEVSLGDYVLSGGEVAVLVIVEALSRLLPGVLGNERSAAEDSFAGPGGLLEAPAYTRPPHWRDLDVPAVLLSGNHAAIEQWRAEQGRARTALARPDLLA